jgi:hypothetical protein
MRFKILLFFLTLAFLGGTLLAAWWFYENIDRPERRADARLRQREQAGTAGTLPDPSHPSYVKAIESLTAGEIDSAHAQLARMLDIYHDSPHAAEARRIIGEINMDRLFSRSPMPGKRDYVVKPGDSLLRIEKGSRTTIPFLRVLNRLSSHVLQPGDRLVYQPLEFEIDIDLSRKVLTLHRQGAGGTDREFFKEYAVAAVALPPGTPKTLKTQIHEKAAWLGDKKIGPVDPKYAFARKWMQTTSRPARPGLLLRPVSEHTAPPAPDDEEAKPAFGIFLDDGDLEELNTIIRPGTPLVLRQ